jgi:hypothetical protein
VTVRLAGGATTVTGRGLAGGATVTGEAATGPGRAGGGVATVTGRGGWLRAAASAFLRSHRIARLRDIAEIEARFRARGRASRRAARTGVLEVLAHPLSLIVFDRTGVRLTANADRFERVEDRPTLDFQFPR